MIKDIDLCLSPQEAYEKELLRKRCAAKCGVKTKDVTSAVYLKKSVDSRRKDIKVNARVRVFIDEDDGWTVVTEDELPSAQWEHTFVMTENGVEILTY